MLFSLEWLRELCPVEADAAAVAAALTARGLTVDAVTAADDDHVLDVDVPANRPDCLGHRGLAREIAAAFGTALAPAPSGPASPEAPAGIRVRVDEPAACRRYTARVVRGVRVGPSPAWVVRRLEACGLRSVNSAVDASNLVLLETGNPLHFFDLSKLAGPAIRVRRAEPGERLTTLDGAERALDPDILVIADAERAVAVAGVLGGADSEIGPATRDVLIEGASFDRAVVRRAARRLGLRTDASYRFERGVDPEALPAAQERAVELLVALCGGEPAPGLADVRSAAASPRELVLRTSELRRVLGWQPPDDEVAGALGVLGLAPAPRAGGGGFAVTVPSWRIDLEREADLVEEVARHVGYDRIPARRALPAIESPGAADATAERARDLLVRLGFHEAFGYAMIADDEDGPWVPPGTARAPRLVNPIAEPLARLRRSLVPGLLRALDTNARRGLGDVRLFETGHVFGAAAVGDAWPRERRHAGLVWSGAGRPRHWSEPDREVDLADVLGAVESVLSGLRPGVAWSRRAGAGRPGFHPGRSATWSAEGLGDVAWAGALHPSGPGPAVPGTHAGEIDLAALESLPPALPRHEPLPRLTAVTRDLALVLGPDHPYARVAEALAAVPAPARARFEAVDRYAGPPLAPGEASLTVRVTLEPDERTLTEDEIETYRRALVERIARDLGVRLRGEA